MRIASAIAVVLAVGALLAGTSGTLAQAPPVDGLQPSLLDEARFGLLAHSADGNNAEDGVDINLEVLFRRPGITYDDPLLNVLLRPRVHLGTSLNTVGDTNQVYAGLTWDVKLAEKLSLELSFGGALHDGPTGNGDTDSYGCALNFRESVSLGYALDERWTLYATVAHMSNADLCDRNTGLTSAGVRLGYKLR